MSVPQNLGGLFKDTVGRFPEKKAFFFKEGGKYVSLTWKEAGRKADLLAGFLSKQGLRAGDRLAILSENRPEWALTDLAAQMLGVVTVPIYTSLTSAEIQYILQDSGAKALAVSGRALFEKIPSIQNTLPELRFIIAFDSAVKLYAQAVTLPVHVLTDIEKTAAALDPGAGICLSRPGDLASIIYTSGTTGRPKGVMLTHDNFIQNVVMCKEALKMGEADAHLSFLPLCHVFERTAGHYLMIFIGASIAYAENMDTVPKNIMEARPTFLLGVPRFYEKVQARVSEKVAQAPELRQKLFMWAKELRRKKRNREPWSAADVLFSPLAAVLVYKKFNKGLGGRLRFCFSGGAPLAKEVAEFFYDLGIIIYEGYGLTETAPVMSFNREDRVRFGSVGIPVDGVEVKIAPDGEIVTKSVCVMKGYYNKPEETAEVLKDGWFHTGDLGHLDADGFLFITGRKKELIVTSGGKKVSPRPIEEMLEKDPYILRCVLLGDGKKYITALIVPRREALTEHAHQQKLAVSDYEALLKEKKIYEFLDQRIQEHMKDLASYEKIKYFALLPEDFTQESGELTPTLKVKRDVVRSRHLARIDSLYAHE